MLAQFFLAMLHVEVAVVGIAYAFLEGKSLPVGSDHLLVLRFFERIENEQIRIRTIFSKVRLINGELFGFQLRYSASFSRMESALSTL